MSVQLHGTNVRKAFPPCMVRFCYVLVSRFEPLSNMCDLKDQLLEISP